VKVLGNVLATVTEHAVTTLAAIDRVVKAVVAVEVVGAAEVGAVEVEVETETRLRHRKKI